MPDSVSICSCSWSCPSSTVMSGFLGYCLNTSLSKVWRRTGFVTQSFTKFRLLSQLSHCKSDCYIISWKTSDCLWAQAPRWKNKLCLSHHKLVIMILVAFQNCNVTRDGSEIPNRINGLWYRLHFACRNLSLATSSVQQSTSALFLL